ncbi:MAG: pyrroline-5-carboxylate reductase [Proteobacteria bacterium]|nr:pyrroline-5-carboxylate reductase [Pseudomonadota bacterium]
MKDGKNINLALIGCGKMGTAMLRGWLASSIENRIYILDPAGIPEDLQDYVPNPVSFFTDPAKFVSAAPAADIFIIAVKPQIMENVCRSIAKAVPRSALVLSIAAGQTITSFERRFGTAQPVVRAMPNTPASIGEGISAAVANGNVTENQKEQADAVLKSIGKTEWVDDESLLDAITAVSGSGPAYVFLLIEIMAEAGCKAGLPADLAMRLARQTVVGASALAKKETALPVSSLRQSVTSPGGTTEAALRVLMGGPMQRLFDEAIAAATARGKELGN